MKHLPEPLYLLTFLLMLITFVVQAQEKYYCYQHLATVQGDSVFIEDEKYYYSSVTFSGNKKWEGIRTDSLFIESMRITQTRCFHEEHFCRYYVAIKGYTFECYHQIIVITGENKFYYVVMPVLMSKKKEFKRALFFMYSNVAFNYRKDFFER